MLCSLAKWDLAAAPPAGPAHLQELLNEPNIGDPANLIYETFKRDRRKYDQ